MKDEKSLFVEHNNTLQIIKFQEILEKFNISEDMFLLLQEDYRQARAKNGISESTHYEVIECFLDLIEENIVKKGDLL